MTTNDFIAVLARIAQDVGIEATHAALAGIRERRNDDGSLYSAQAEFELEIARICLAAGALDEARECWDRAADLLACYGRHKDPTLSEVVDSISDIHDVTKARERLAKLVPLVYQHTDGRDTSHYRAEWWELAATIDPIAAAYGAGDLYLKTIGFEDHRAETAQTQLLQRHTDDPNAYRCSSNNVIYDPCYSPPYGGSDVVCVSAPWDVATEIRLTAPLPANPVDDANPTTWAFRLSNGAGRVENTGTNTEFGGITMYYSCTNGGEAGGLLQKSTTWTAKYLPPHSSTITTVAVHTAWHG